MGGLEDGGVQFSDGGAGGDDVAGRAPVRAKAHNGEASIEDRTRVAEPYCFEGVGEGTRCASQGSTGRCVEAQVFQSGQRDRAGGIRPAGMRQPTRETSSRCFRPCCFEAHPPPADRSRSSGPRR